MTTLIANEELHAIAEFLDDRSHEDRVKCIRSLSWSSQRDLYLKAEQSEPLDLSFFVPDEIEPLVEVRHPGWNGLPRVPGVPDYKHFEKRFCRSANESALYGYNHAAIHEHIGPGYFVAHTVEDPRGTVLIDYRQVPQYPVVEGWPPVVPNEKGLQFFVLRGTSDYMRRVSTHVSVGAAFKGDRKLNAYFVLTRA